MGKEEPVSNANIEFLSTQNCPTDNDRIDNPKNRQLNVYIPLRLRAFYALRNTKQISETCQHHNKLVVPDHRECEITPAEKRGPIRALHAIERTADQNIAAEREQ